MHFKMPEDVLNGAEGAGIFDVPLKISSQASSSTYFKQLQQSVQASNSKISGVSRDSPTIKVLAGAILLGWASLSNQPL